MSSMCLPVSGKVTFSTQLFEYNTMEARKTVRNDDPEERHAIWAAVLSSRVDQQRLRGLPRVTTNKPQARAVLGDEVGPPEAGCTASGINFDLPPSPRLPNRVRGHTRLFRRQGDAHPTTGLVSGQPADTRDLGVATAPLPRSGTGLVGTSSPKSVGHP